MTGIQYSMSDFTLHSVMRELHMLKTNEEKYNVVVDNFNQNDFALLKAILEGGHVGYFDELLRLDIDIFHIDSAKTQALYDRLQQAKTKNNHNLAMQIMAKGYDDYLRDRQRRKRLTFVSAFGAGAIALYVMFRRAFVTKQTLKQVAQSLEAVPLVGIFFAGVVLGLGAFEVVRSITSTRMTHFSMSNAMLNAIETLSKSSGYVLIALHATALGAALLFVISSGVSIFKDILEYMKARQELNFKTESNAHTDAIEVSSNVEQQTECARLSLSACKKQLLTDVICGSVIVLSTFFCFFPGLIIGSAAVRLGMMGAMAVGLAGIVVTALVKSVLTRKMRENLGAEIQYWNTQRPIKVNMHVPERLPGMLMAAVPSDGSCPCDDKGMELGDVVTPPSENAC